MVSQRATPESIQPMGLGRFRRPGAWGNSDDILVLESPSTRTSIAGALASRSSPRRQLLLRLAHLATVAALALAGALLLGTTITTSRVMIAARRLRVLMDSAQQELPRRAPGTRPAPRSPLTPPALPLFRVPPLESPPVSLPRQ